VEVEYHPEAEAEYHAAIEEYVAYSDETGARFIGEVGRAMQRILQAPHRWPAHLHGTQRVLLRRYPFSVVYVHDPDRVFIIAVAHQKRRPGYWRKRLR